MSKRRNRNASKSQTIGTVAGSAASDAVTRKLGRGLPLPSTNPATNLLIADVVVRGASSLFRKNVERRVVEASADDHDRAHELLDGRTLLTTLGLYGASKLATRSVPGLMIVTGGLVAKTLYDRGKERQKRKAREKRPSQQPD